MAAAGRLTRRLVLLGGLALAAASQPDGAAVLKDGALLQWYTGLASNLFSVKGQQVSSGADQTDTAAHSLVSTEGHSKSNQASLEVDQAGASTTAPSTVRPITTASQAPNCGAKVDGSLADGGVITTPGYPEQYGQGLYCVWTIAGGKGKRVRLEFEDFELTKTPSCSGDYLFVSTTGDANDTSAEPLCGTDTPGEYVSDEDVLYLEFRSTPDGDTCRGFSARYIIEEVVVTCGQEVSFLEFDFQSPDYPEPIANGSSHCELTVSHDCEVPICQVRLDFVEFELQPPEYGNCDSDQFMVRANEPVPVLCGNNSGQHMYVEVAGRASTSLHVLLSRILPKPVGHVTDPDTGESQPLEWRYEVEDTRRWKIRVNQIPCECSHDHLKTSSPRGHLNNLDYHVCVRVAQGYCGIMYTPTGPESFLLNGETPYNSTEPRKNLFGSKACQADYVLVPKCRTPGDNDPWSHDRFCGQALGNYVQGPIVSYSTPFYMQVKTDADEYSRSIDLGNRGFELLYTQLPCSGPYLFNSDQKYSG
ncbi:cubilin-like isoform X3 [Eriocheir sinensis]|uniref:cubilin-like isoform X3 n=1 Tax=Eriocheir sinensis TaxID=95602 RepID=UPI0021CA6125|nr:cubilin-like isoform X3 [Eriocheir sinensis]